MEAGSPSTWQAAKEALSYSELPSLTSPGWGIPSLGGTFLAPNLMLTSLG